MSTESTDGMPVKPHMTTHPTAEVMIPGQGHYRIEVPEGTAARTFRKVDGTWVDVHMDDVPGPVFGAMLEALGPEAVIGALDGIKGAINRPNVGGR